MQVDAFVVAAAAAVEVVEAVEDDMARAGFTLARSSRCASGTPLHWPITLQPSTQSWRVIWVRVGKARNASSENSSGRSTMPRRRRR